MQYIRRAPLLLVVALGFLLFLIPRPSLAAQFTISTMDDFFSPQILTVSVGDTVTWKNNGSATHSVVSDNGVVNSGTILPGQSFSFTVNTAGSFPYHDQYYGSAGNGMTGTLTIVPATQAVPSTTDESSQIAQLETQIQTLLAQIQALEGSTAQSSQVTTQSGGNVSTYAPSCPLIGETLKLGSSGDDVSRLQQFLASDPTIYPEGLVTGYYGTLTQAAVQKWQAKFNIVSSGTPDSTGYGVVGPRTAAAISIICAGGSINGVSGAAAASPVGGFISVTPIAGTAPLTVNVAATVNTTASCTGATYTLNFGDNTAAQQIPVPAGNCGELQQNYQHIYQYGGSYTITLSSGSHSTTATVSVTGPAAPSTPATGTTGGVPAGVISAFVRSGTAPLSVTFYVSCVAGNAYDVVFGDGQDLGGANVGQTTCNGSLQAVTHTYTTAGSYQAQLEIFVTQSNGTIIPQAWGTVPITVNGNETSSDNSSYQTPTLQSTGSNSLAFTLNFDLPSSCTGYDVSWGDGTPDDSQSDGGSSCAQGTVTESLAHTYASAGSYTVVLKRGQTLTRVDDMSITIAQ